ncbi:MAG TPA: M20/M25/M40 family metallo-hydrolase [Candidatus Methylomirabilis sp.]|nr:M20/M25/M40 family metallo-hydrolase [Candidatus Methylomirabilis sp.]
MRPEMVSRGAVLDVLQQLVRIPSVNPTLVPEEAKGEAAVAAFACDWLSRQGVRAWLEEAAPGRPNVVAEVGVGGGPSLVLCAHLDTVGTAGMTISPFEPRLEEGKVFGRGSYDMKGSVAAVMAAVAGLARTGLRGRVTAALVADEEYASIGATDFVRRHNADGCILTEPSEGRLILGHKGFVWAELVTTGRAAHGSRWDLGVSAIGKMGRIIAALEQFDREVLRKRVHPLVGPASMHCALVQGGAGLSTYAAECRLKVERRTLPGETPEQFVRELEGIARQAGEEADVRCLFDRSPLLCDREAPVACRLRDAVQAVTGRAPAEAGVAYWMDAAIFAAAGIPTVNYGPSGAGAHEAVEWVDLDSVVICARILVEAARRFCSSV